MFLTLVKILSSKCNKVVRESVRCKHGNLRKTIKRRREMNPGVQLQSNLFKDEKQTKFDDVDLDELESDFMNVGLSHKQHIEQLELQKEKEKYLIVKQKYFKEKTPNFLTWSDKQQIRYLHSTDPEQWTIEKLSEGFPALPEVIIKLIKSNWTKKDANKIKNHDNSVMTNWNLFKQKKLTDLPQDLVQHLNKFTNRQLNFTSFNLYEDEKPNESNNVVVGEFSEIITSYKHIKDKTCNADQTITAGIENINDRKPKKDTYVTIPVEHYIKKKNVTLRQFQTDLEADVNIGHDINEEDKFMLQQLKQPVEISVPENPIIDITTVNNAKMGPLSTQVLNKKDYTHLIYPDKISIPKKMYKRGYTYKLNDCFYDCDGLFLFRVPGMDK